MTESGTRRSSSRDTTRWTTRRIAALVVVALFVLLIVTNRSPVTIQLLLIDLTGPLWVLLIAAFGLGALVAWLWIGRRRRP